MNLWFDVKYAWRLLGKSWGHSLLCAGVVALSVGLALWTYVLAYSQVLKPLGFPGSERWYSVQIAADATATARPSVDAFTYQEIRNRNRTGEFLGAFSHQAVVLSEGQASTSLRAAAISPRLLAATAVAPLLGRVFDEADSEAGAAPAAILSFDTWQRYFAANPDVIGTQARIDARPVQIVGVMPRDFYAFEDFEIWLPLHLQNLARPSDSNTTFSPFIVLREHQNLDAVANEMKAAVDAVNRDYPELFKTTRQVELIPANRMKTHGRVQVVATLALLTLAVLLLGCVNISMVFLARLLERSRELALRTALGASRSRLIRQCLLETAFVVLIGLLGGYGLAAAGVNWAQGLSNYGAQIQASGRSSNVLVLHSSDLVAAVIAAIAVWLLSTLVPAWRIARQDAAQVLAGTGKGAAVRGSSKSASMLVGLQVVISCLVLVICGNLVLAVNQEANKPAGFSTTQVMISTYTTAFDARYSEAGQRLRYWDDLTAAIKSRLPGAEVAYATAVPTWPDTVPVAIDAQEGFAHRGTLELPLTAVADEYFDLLGLRLRSGRLFDSTDNSASLAVGIVDEHTARRYWPQQDALGKRIQLNPTDNGPWLTIVGVVSHARRPYDRDVGVIYQPLRQAAPASFHLIVKLPSEAQNSRAELRAAAFAVDRDLPLHNLQMLQSYLRAKNQVVTSLVPVFIAVATITALLAATGLFGLISRSVAQRTQDVGVRRALGATQWQAISMFIRQGAVYLGIGIVGVILGIVVANLMARVFNNILDNVAAVTLGVLLLMSLVIFAASYLPTRRAVALEPGDALRYE